MFYSILVLILSCLLAVGYQRRAVFVEDRALKHFGWHSWRSDAKILFFLLILVIILYSGLRTRSNDTDAYIYFFIYGIPSGFSEIFKLSIRTEEVGFQAYQILIKTVFGNNYARFLTVTALLTFGSYLQFFKRYSSNFLLAVFLLFTTTFFEFSLAAIRQCIAIAIGIWSIPCFIKKHYLSGILIVVLAALFHKFSLVFLSAIFLRGDVFNTKTILIIIGTAVVSSFFTSIFTSIANNTEYTVAYLVETEGTNFLRVLVWCVPVALSLVFRHSINRLSDTSTKMFINLSLIGSMLMVLASFGGANLIARTAFYFYPYFILSFTEMIQPSIMGRNTALIRQLCYIGFFAYFVVLLLQGNFGFFEDALRHNSVLVLFERTWTVF